eukprot:1909352-Pyramimonas_sp.AAC.2
MDSRGTRKEPKCDCSLTQKTQHICGGRQALSHLASLKYAEGHHAEAEGLFQRCVDLKHSRTANVLVVGTEQHNERVANLQ